MEVMKKYDVYAIGNALVDIEYHANPQRLTELNIEKGFRNDRCEIGKRASELSEEDIRLHQSHNDLRDNGGRNLRNLVDANPFATCTDSTELGHRNACGVRSLRHLDFIQDIVLRFAS